MDQPDWPADVRGGGKCTKTRTPASTPAVGASGHNFVVQMRADGVLDTLDYEILRERHERSGRRDSRLRRPMCENIEELEQLERHGDELVTKISARVARREKEAPVETGLNMSWADRVRRSIKAEAMHPGAKAKPAPKATRGSVRVAHNVKAQDRQISHIIHCRHVVSGTAYF